MEKRNRLFNEANVLPDKPVRQWFGSQYSQSHSLELNDEFVGAFNLIENTNDSIFITGKAGTGKSTPFKYFKKNTAKNVAVLAPTRCCGGGRKHWTHSGHSGAFWGAFWAFWGHIT